MILVMDVGNTNMKIGLFEGDRLMESWRVSVVQIRTADEYGMTILNLFKANGISVSRIEGIIVSSVVPSLNYTLEHMCTYYFKMKPIMVSSRINTGLTFAYEHAEELGADRVANAVAAYSLYGSPIIIVDMGTATTLGAVSEDGVFLGGAIAPGLRSSVDNLGGNAAKLRKIELMRPAKAICRNTVQNMQSGAVFGFTGLLRYMIDLFKKEMNSPNIKVVATGGLVQLIDNSDGMFDIVDRALTLKGLRILYDMNKENV